MTATPDTQAPLTTVALVTLGCARNEVDSEELAGRLEAGGFRLVDDPEDADTVVVNTCGFVEAAKKDSVDTLLEAADLKADGPRPRPSSPSAAWPSGTARTSPSRCPRPTPCSASTTTPTSPPGCARSWPGSRTTPHTPQDRRRLLPISPVERATPADASSCPGTRSSAPDLPRRRGARRPVPAPYAAGSTAARWRRSSWPAAATGAARSARSRSFRGSFVSPPAQRRARTRRAGSASRASASCSWSARTPRPTARTSATCGCSRRCCPSWPPSTASSGCGCPTSSPPRPGPAWSRRSRRRPASRPTSTCPSSTPARRCCAGCAASATPRASSACSSRSARWRPQAGVRSNVIVGFPGETEDDLETLCDFLVAARLDVTGVFGYSDEDGTEAASYDGKLDEDEVRARVEHVTAPGRGAHRPARRGADRRDGRRAGRVAVDGDGRRGPRRPPGPGGRRHHDARAGARRRRASATWSRAVVVGTDGRRPGRPTDRSRRDDRRRRAPGQQLEPAQRADHAADRDGAVLRLGAARRRRRLGRVALRRVRALRGRDDHRQDRRRHRPRPATWSPTSARSPTRSPTRRSPAWPSSGCRSSATSGGG